MSEPTTDFINSTEDTIDQIASLLSTAQTTWDVRIFSGTSVEDIQKFVVGLQPPASVIVYEGSNWKADPNRRASRYAIVLVCRNHDIEAGGETVRGMLDSAVDAVDWQIYNGALIRAESDDTLDFGSGISAIKLTISVEDR